VRQRSGVDHCGGRRASRWRRPRRVIEHQHIDGSADNRGREQYFVGRGDGPRRRAALLPRGRQNDLRECDRRPPRRALLPTRLGARCTGIYNYNTTGSTSSLLGTKSFPPVTTLTIDAPTGTRQHSVRQLESSNGDGFVIDQILDYQPDGVAVVQQRLAMTQSGNKTVRTLNAAAAPVAIRLGPDRQPPRVRPHGQQDRRS